MIEKEVIVEKEVPVTVEVEREKVVEKKIVETVEVEKVVEKVVTPTPLPEKPKPKGKIMLWGWTAAIRDTVEAAGIIEDFKAEYPDIEVEIEYYGPNEVYTNLPLALIAGERGKTKRARRHARAALEAESRPHSGLRYQPHLGLVDETQRRVQARLKKLAGG